MSSEPIRAIDEMKLLEADWDSYGAPPVADVARDNAKALILAIEKAIGDAYGSPLVSPTPEGGVALIWRHGRRVKVQVFVGLTGAVRFSVVEYGRVTNRAEIDDLAHFASAILQKYIAL